MTRIAVISVHGCPLVPLGGKETGGMNVCVRELGRELGRRGVAVDVFTRWHEPWVSRVVEFGDNARVIHLEAGEKGRIVKREVYRHLPEFLCQLLQFTEENGLKYDLLHSHYWLSGWVGNILRQRWQVPYVASFHTLGEVKRRARKGEQEPNLRIEAEKRIVASADRLIAAGADEKNQLVRLYGASPYKVDIIPCGVDLSVFRPFNKAAARKRIGFYGGKLVLFVGRIEPLKGIDLLLDAFAQLEEVEGLRLLVVGGDFQSDDELRQLRQKAAQLGIAHRVNFIGAVKQEELPLFYSAADVCVVPSYYESFGMVAVEALACGTPVVAARVGGLLGTVRDGENGYLIPWHCPDPFAERLELLLNSDLLRCEFGKAARASVERFSWSLIGDQVMRVYTELLSGVGLEVCYNNK